MMRRSLANGRVRSDIVEQWTMAGILLQINVSINRTALGSKLSRAALYTEKTYKKGRYQK